MEKAIFESPREQPIGILASWRNSLTQSPEAVTAFVLVLVFTFFSFSAPNFLTFYALSNILTFASVFGIVAAGIAFLMISGEFDLSVRGILLISSYIFAFSLLAGIPPVVAMFFSLIASIMLGLVNGLLVTAANIPSFIITLGTSLAYRGIARAMDGPGGPMISYTPKVKPLLFIVLNGYVAPLNELTDPAGNLRTASLWFIGLTALMSLILTRSAYGNRTFAVGGNPAAALAQGVDVKRVKLINYVISGLLAGLAGVILFAWRGSVNEMVGDGLEMNVVAAAVLGGVSLYGGVGTIVGASLGMLLLSMLEQGLVLMAVPNDVFRGVVGTIIIISAVLRTYVERQ